jgi:hypothetical protein
MLQSANTLGGYLYIIRASESIEQLFKVGRALNLKSRMFSYQTGRAHEVDLLYVLSVYDMKSAERCVKEHLKEFQYRTRREVYQLPIDMLKDIMTKCNAVDGAKKEYVRRHALSPQKSSGGAPMKFYVAFNRNLVLPL